ncbi:MAG: hypothetical protein Q7S84_03855 [bacterium]|nr:hypothetical protein [bacterium]
MSFEQTDEQERNRERYQEDLARLEAAKERLVATKLFSQEFLDSLRFVFGDEIKQEDDGTITTFVLNPDGTRTPLAGLNDKKVDVAVLSAVLLERVHEFAVPVDDMHASMELWMRTPVWRDIYSFDAVAVHEVAHAESFRVIPVGTALERRPIPFARSKFVNLVQSLVRGDDELRRIDDADNTIDFSKFRMNLMEWSEVYAQVYQREFNRRSDPNGTTNVAVWDADIADTAEHITDRLRELSEKTGRDLDKSHVYNECHALSLLVTSALERTFPKFEDRIAALAGCRQESAAQ